MLLAFQTPEFHVKFLNHFVGLDQKLMIIKIVTNCQNCHNGHKNLA